MRHEDPTLPVDPDDVIAVEQAATLPPVPSDAMFELMIQQQQERTDLTGIVAPQRRLRRIATALVLGLVTVTGILIAVAHRHRSKATAAPVAIRVRSPVETPRVTRPRVHRSHARAHRPRSTARVAVAVRSRHVTIGPRAKRRLARHLGAARRAARRGQWTVARLQARRALRIDRHNRKARTLERRARHRLVAKQLKHARRDIKRHRWKRARRHAVAALRVDPRNRTARKIKRQAEVRMRRRA